MPTNGLVHSDQTVVLLMSTLVHQELKLEEPLEVRKKLEEEDNQVQIHGNNT